MNAVEPLLWVGLCQIVAVLKIEPRTSVSGGCLLGALTLSGSVFIGMGVPTHDDCCENRVTEAHASGAHWARAGRLLTRGGSVFMGRLLTRCGSVFMGMGVPTHDA